MSSLDLTQKVPVIALLGQPNSGKSTLFNALTGARQHVGNWPGKTVEKKEGYYLRDGNKFIVTDLPGSYSLFANSEEEIITRNYIAEGHADVVTILVDASQIERSLFMLADYAGMNCPVVLLLNLMDVANQKGLTIDVKRIEERLGIPVIPFVAADRKEYDGFHQAIEKALKRRDPLQVEGLYKHYQSIEHGLFDRIYHLLPEHGIEGFSAMWLAAKAIEKDTFVLEKIHAVLSPEKQQKLDQILNEVQEGSILVGSAKFQWVDEILEGAVLGKTQKKTLSGFDRLATSKRWGKGLAILILLLGLVGSFIPAAPIMLLATPIMKLGVPLANFLSSIGIPNILTSILSDVALNSLAFAIAMIGFVFGVNLVFGFIEEIGYMARVSYVFDGTMSRLGLQGKAVMPMIVSFGCTIGGAAGTRVIDNWGQKVLTIALAWVVPCAATWTIVPYLSSLYFGVWAPLVVLAIFLVAALHMMITAKIFGPKLVKPEDRSGLIMELPPYHKPKWAALLRSVFVRTGDIFWRAIKVIFVVSLLFWLLTYTRSGSPETTLLYRFGRFIEPVTKVFGLTWQTFLAFLSSAVSKEASLGVLSTLYVGGGSLFSSTLGGTAASTTGLSDMLTASITQAQALAFIFAVTFNIPCLMALSSTYQETRSLTWTLRIALYYFVAALVLSFMAYHIGNLIF